MHHWHEERKHPLGKYKAGKERMGKQGQEKKVKRKFLSFSSEEVVTYISSPQHLHSQCVTAGVVVLKGGDLIRDNQIERGNKTTE